MKLRILHLSPLCPTASPPRNLQNKRKRAEFLLLGLAKDATSTENLVLQARFLSCLHILVRVMKLRQRIASACQAKTATCKVRRYGERRGRGARLTDYATTQAGDGIYMCMCAKHLKSEMCRAAKKEKSSSAHNAALLLGREVVDVLDEHPLGKALGLGLQPANKDTEHFCDLFRGLGGKGEETILRCSYFRNITGISQSSLSKIINGTPAVRGC